MTTKTTTPKESQLAENFDTLATKVRNIGLEFDALHNGGTVGFSECSERKAVRLNISTDVDMGGFSSPDSLIPRNYSNYQHTNVNRGYVGVRPETQPSLRAATRTAYELAIEFLDSNEFTVLVKADHTILEVEVSCKVREDHCPKGFKMVAEEPAAE